MAVDTLLAHETLMRIILDVAGQTLGRRIPKFVFRRVTVRANGLQVSANQGEVSEVVIERRFIEDHDLRIATLVIGVAAGAVFTPGIRGTAVKPGAAPNVCANIFVAIDTKLRLRVTVEHDVAGAALGLGIRMRVDDVTGHDKRLDGLGARG
jgi:hypothetical protein